MSELVIPHTFVEDTDAEAAQVNANFDAIKTLINNGLGSDNLAGSAVKRGHIDFYFTAAAEIHNSGPDHYPAAKVSSVPPGLYLAIATINPGPEAEIVLKSSGGSATRTPASDVGPARTASSNFRRVTAAAVFSVTATVSWIAPDLIVHGAGDVEVGMLIVGVKA